LVEQLVFVLHLMMQARDVQARAAAARSCVAGEATLHNAWAGVFAHFPERLDEAVDGYVAVADCGEMGRYKRLYLGGRWFRVRVADCRNPADEATMEWLVDVDYRLWWLVFAKEGLRPRRAILCVLP